MYFLIKNEEFLEKYSKNWEKKISIIIKNKFNRNIRNYFLEKL